MFRDVVCCEAVVDFAKYVTREGFSQSMYGSKLEPSNSGFRSALVSYAYRLLFPRTPAEVSTFL